MKKLLVPIDFSKPSLAALDVACGIAKKTGSSVIALYVVEETSSDSFKSSGGARSDGAEEKIYTYKLLERSRDRLTRLVLNPRYASIKLDGELRMGNPFHGINKLIIDRKIDMVVMGVKGRSQWEQMIIGSNTEKVVRCSNIPVLTVHKKPIRAINFKNIVYATALLKDEKNFSPVIKKIQKTYGAKLHLVHINTPGGFQQDKKVQQRMEQFAKKMKLENYTVNVYGDFTAEEGILHFAETVRADMVAMSSHGRQGFAHLIAGSVAEDVMNHAKRPTLVYVTKQ